MKEFIYTVKTSAMNYPMRTEVLASSRKAAEKRLRTSLGMCNIQILKYIGVQEKQMPNVYLTK